MVSKAFPQKKLDEEQKQRQVRKAHISQAIEAAMTNKGRESVHILEMARTLMLFFNKKVCDYVSPIYVKN